MSLVSPSCQPADPQASTTLKWASDGELSALDLERILERLCAVDRIEHECARFTDAAVHIVRRFLGEPAIVWTLVEQAFSQQRIDGEVDVGDGAKLSLGLHFERLGSELAR